MYALHTDDLIVAGSDTAEIDHNFKRMPKAKLDITVKGTPRGFPWCQY